MTCMNNCHRTYYIYKITRSDGLLYIGTTDSKCIKNRMCRHRSSDRFAGYGFNYEILEASETPDIFEKEVYYIQTFNTLVPHGLNVSIDGKGNHLSPKFTTRGFTFSKKSRKRMSESSKRRIRTTGWTHAEETKRHWSETRTGKCWKRPALTKKQWDELNFLWLSKPSCPLVNSLNKKITYERSFAKQYAAHFGLTTNGLHNIITNKLKVFKFPGEYPVRDTDT